MAQLAPPCKPLVPLSSHCAGSPTCHKKETTYWIEQNIKRRAGPALCVYSLLGCNRHSVEWTEEEKIRRQISRNKVTITRSGSSQVNIYIYICFSVEKNYIIAAFCSFLFLSQNLCPIYVHTITYFRSVTYYIQIHTSTEEERDTFL